ncbi:MAG: hypothetical protein FWE80_04680, partial [Oscillospiraceae bacterium]|nr:hypothetical protein [Oscillospiraceae bacterium]
MKKRLSIIVLALVLCANAVLFTFGTGNVLAGTIQVEVPLVIQNVTASGSLGGNFSPDNLIDMTRIDLGSSNDISNALFTSGDWMGRQWLTGDDPTVVDVWVLFELNDVEEIHQIAIWNSTDLFGSDEHRGIEDITISYSADSTDGIDGTWEALGNYTIPEMPGGGAAPVTPQLVIPMDEQALFVKIIVVSNYGNADYGLGKVVLTALDEIEESENDVTLDVPDSKDIDVTAKYEGAITTPMVYSVDLSWGAMEFTYNASGTKDWQPGSHSYIENLTTSSWSASGNTITVTNHSNAAVDADFAYSSESGYAAVTGSFNRDSFTLPTAEGTAFSAAPNNSATLTLAGTLS